MLVIGVVFVVLVFLVVVFSVVWVWQLCSGNVGMVDLVWVFLLGMVVLFYVWLGVGLLFVCVLVGVGGVVWGVCFGWYLWCCNVGKLEDVCYWKLCEEWGIVVL